jgi:inosine-uridine nucleoside N-ribohydrolase
MEPRIREKTVVVWLGGQPRYWPTASEFNLKQDPHASRTIFDSGVPLVQIPCSDVSEHLATTIPELEHYLKGRNALCDYLVETTAQYMRERQVMSKVVWDISAVAWARHPEWVPTRLAASPILTSELTWSFDPGRHQIRVATDTRRDPIFGDLFALLTR